jgi:hypothetical protein
VEVVGRAAHRQRVQRPLPDFLVEENKPGECVRIEQVREVADGVGDVDEPTVESPLGDVVAGAEAEGEVGRLAGLERCHDLVPKFILLKKESSTCLPLSCSKVAMMSLSASSSWA